MAEHESTRDEGAEPVVSLLASLQRWATIAGERIALADDHRTLSYRELARHICAAASFLEGAGVTRGDRVVLSSANSVEMALAYFAVHAAGAVAVPVDPGASADSLRAIVQHARPRLVVVAENALASDATGLPRVALQELASSPGSDDAVVPSPPMDDVADVLFTTGTTGRAKGVVLTHANIAHAARNVATFLEQREDDVEVVVVPLTHSFGLGRVRCMARTGSTLVLKAGMRSPAELIDALVSRRATGLALVPAGFAMLRRLTKNALEKAAPHLKYVEIGSAAMDGDLREWLLERLPAARICHHYGLTEASRAAFVELRSEAGRQGSIGRASPNVELSLIDEQGQIVAGPDIEGELCVRGSMVMREYLDDPAMSRNALVDGALRTGDLALRNERGDYFLRGRIGDIINVGGLKVVPDEVEGYLLRYPGILEAACVAMRDPQGVMGERVRAVVVASAPIATAPLVEWLRQQGLEAHKLPRTVDVVDQLPRTASGKLLRRQLR